MKQNPIWGTSKTTYQQHWGHLTLMDVYESPLILNRPDGTTYVADSRGGPTMWRLRCDCGHQFEIEKSAFPGRRVARNCNRPECPYVNGSYRVKETSTYTPAPGRGHKVSNSGRVYSMYFPEDIAGQMEQYAQQKGISFAKAVRELAVDGLVAKMLEE